MADPSALTHKWIAIVHNSLSERKGTIKDRVEGGIAFQLHTQKALELDPSDPTLHYMMGRFCYDISFLTWIERQGARAISGKEPPKATVSDALGYFEKAYSMKPCPSFALEIARCYLNLKNDTKAKEFFQIASSLVPEKDTPFSPEDHDAAVQATEMLAKLNVKA